MFWQIFTYASLMFFLVMIIARAVRIITAPQHLRWELYPVPHEKGRASYGGSRLEEVDWWTKPQEKDHIAEIKAMAAEIVFLKGVWEHNRKLWFGSFPFHFGLYIYIVNSFIILFAAILNLNGTPVDANTTGFPLLVSEVIMLLGWAGGILGIAGSIILLYRRMVDKNLKTYSNASHYFNIVLIGALFVSAFIWILTDADIVGNMVQCTAALMTYSAMPDSIPVIGYVDMAITLIFMLYLPLTHMTHFFTKYFTYHHVRWEDAPNVPNGKIAKRIEEQLHLPVSWAAPHIGADGKKNWLVIATSPVGKKEDK